MFSVHSHRALFKERIVFVIIVMGNLCVDTSIQAYTAASIFFFFFFLCTGYVVGCGGGWVMGRNG